MPRVSASPKSRKNTKKHDYKRYFLLAGLSIFSLAFLSFYSFFKNFSKACIFADSQDSSSFNSSAYSVALLTLDGALESTPAKVQDIKILYVKPNSTGSFVLNIPVETDFDMPGKYGDESFSSVLALGMLNSSQEDESCSDECLSSGMTYVESALASLTAHSINKWIVVTPDMSEYAQSLLVRGDPFSFFDKNNIKLLSNSLRTNFTFSEFLSHYNSLRSVDTKNLKEVTFSSQQALDNSLRELNFNSEVASQELSISILNATKTPGVATFGSRVVKNVGGHVISVENASEVIEKTVLITSDPESVASKYLSKFFNVSKIYSKSESPLSDSSIDRADITLVLGLDFLENF